MSRNFLSSALLKRQATEIKQAPRGTGLTGLAPTAIFLQQSASYRGLRFIIAATSHKRRETLHHELPISTVQFPDPNSLMSSIAFPTRRCVILRAFAMAAMPMSQGQPRSLQ